MALLYATGAPDLSVSDLRLLIQQQEELIGPLRDIGTNGYGTVLAFDPNEEPPSNPPALQLAVEGQPKPEHVISEGLGFVDGRLRSLIVYRPVRSASEAAA
jgi:hypothetical protein